MAAKDVLFSSDARDRMLKGVNILANAVKVYTGKAGCRCTPSRCSFFSLACAVALWNLKQLSSISGDCLSISFFILSVVYPINFAENCSKSLVEPLIRLAESA